MARGPFRAPGRKEVVLSYGTGRTATRGCFQAGKVFGEGQKVVGDQRDVGHAKPA